ncbi:MAG: alpha/beta hydrolase [Lentisphaeraceae bacterium]|nr:alpha/beta hydrolase [Lentisphaeraceae bacterium]
MIFEEKLIFFPEAYPIGEWSPNLDASLKLQEVWFMSDDRHIHGWYLTPKEHSSSHVYLICHGNSGNITDWFAKAQNIAMLGLPVLLFDYRSYGKSEQGPLSEQGIYEDSSAAVRFLNDKGFTNEQIIVHGISLGGGAATYLAAENEVAGLVLESTFTSIPDMCSKLYPFIPKWVVGTKFANLERVKGIYVPSTIFHGTADQLIPYSMGESLFAAMEKSSKKNFISIDDAGHSDLMETAEDTYISGIKKMLLEDVGVQLRVS